MIVQHCTFTSEQLRSIPDKERSLVVLLAHGVNEVNLFDKLTFFSLNHDHTPKWKADVHSAQSMMLIRTLVVKIYATQELLSKHYFGTQLEAEYTGKLNDRDAEVSLDRLHAYMSLDVSNAKERPKSLIQLIRNKIAAHYDDEQGQTEIPKDQPSDELGMYLDADYSNSMYQFAELVITKAVVELCKVPNDDPELALNLLMDDLRRLITWLNAAAHGLMIAIFDRHIGLDSVRSTWQAIDVGLVPNAEEVQIPFFAWNRDRRPT